MLKDLAARVRAEGLAGGADARDHRIGRLLVHERGEAFVLLLLVPVAHARLVFDSFLVLRPRFFELNGHFALAAGVVLGLLVGHRVGF